MQPYGRYEICRLKAEALHLADRTSEALEAIREAQVAVERFEERWWLAELHRLGGVFLVAMGADEAQIEASFRAAISTAKQQKSISLEKRAETTYAEYVAKNRAGQEGTDSDYLFGNRLQRPFLGPCGRAVRSLTSNSSSAVSRRNRCSKNL